MIPRRAFIVAAMTVAGGVAIGLGVPPAGRLAARLQAAKPFDRSGWIFIDPDESVTVLSSFTEMGQGIWSCLTQIVAEELDVDPSLCRVEMAPTWRAYESAGPIDTGASSSTRRIFEQFRPIAACARAMLVAAAAADWSVPASECRTDMGFVVHDSSGRKRTYGGLAALAAKMPVPANVPLKPRRDWKWVGRSIRRLDVPSKADGSARFSIDATTPSMLVAAVSQAPFPNAQVRNIDRTKLSSTARLVELPDALAVVDRNFWSASRGLQSLNLEWDAPRFSTSTLRARIEERLLQTPEVVGTLEGDQVVERSYFAPLLMHAQLEPLNALADARCFTAELFVSTQSQSGMKVAVAHALGISPHAVTIRTGFVGGGFGRRLDADYGVAAARISREVGAPVKAIWSREEDSIQGRFRPMSGARMRAVIHNGSLTAWRASIVSLGRTPGLSGLDSMLYRIPQPVTEYGNVEAAVRIGFWRSVDESQNVFFRESFIDECAHSLGRDPLDFRLQLLANDPRSQAVLRRVSEISRWVARGEEKTALGVAFGEGFGSRCAQVVRLEQNTNGKWRVRKIYVAFDCGTAVNPNGVRAQIEGGVLMGLSAALREEISFEDGRLLERNFDRYQILRMSEAPEVVIDILESSDSEIGGVGEAGVPPVAPALANALFAATGTRIRELPMSRARAPLDY